MMKYLVDLVDWVDARLPVVRAWDTHMGKYYAPKNFNFWYFFGVLSLVVLVNQLLTGIWLTMSYEPSAERAFASVEYIMRDVEYGWLLRYMHSTGASAFFAVVYLHMFRGLLYGSYRKPRELIWIVGMLIYFALMAEGFLGYVLPWGNMSYWGAQVIISLFGAIPVIGEGLVEWIRGDYLISGITLNRFFALHVVALPIILLLLVVVHILALHEVGSNNPDGVEIKKHKDENGVPLDSVPFFPHYLPVHDLQAIIIFLFVFCAIIFFFPEMGGYFIEHANFVEADPLKTPEHIAPVWYYTPFYSMLRAVTVDLSTVFNAKFLGAIVMAGAIAIMFVLPWLDRSPVRSVRYKGAIPRFMILLFAASFIILGVLGVKAPSESRTFMAQVNTLVYFAFFLLMPIYTNPNPTRPFLRIIVCGGFGLFMLGYVVSYWSSIWADPGHMLFAAIYATVLGIFFLMMPRLVARDYVKPEPERITMDGGMGFWRAMGAFLLVAVLSWIPLKAVGAESAFACGSIPCDEIDIDFNDKASLQNGARLYMNYCLACHSLQYSRYERVANDLGIPDDIMMNNLIFDGSKIGSLMENSMPVAAAKKWFGAAPPDLTLMSRAKSPEWLYTYLKNFYTDPSRPYGVNNRVFKDVGMPHVLLELQGETQCGPGPVLAANGGVKRDILTGENLLAGECGQLNVVATGELDAIEFDAAMADLVGFMAYVAEPMVLERKRVGTYVMLFLAVFLVFAWLLNREYWRDVH
ncbi:MAG: ubiquinol-cytochrome c reductase [Pseudomonadota bacterium]